MTFFDITQFYDKKIVFLFASSIKKERFIELRNVIAELLEIKDPLKLFRHAEESDLTSAKTTGKLYNHYKVLRKKLRLAGFLPEKGDKKVPNSSSSSSGNYKKVH